MKANQFIPARIAALLLAATVVQLASAAGDMAQVSAQRPAIDALHRAQDKTRRAQQIADRFAAEMTGQGLADNAWRTELMSALLQGPEAAFSVAEAASTMRQALAAIYALPPAPAAASSAAQAKTLGSSADDLVFHPYSSPCRIVDTRVAGAGGPVPAGTARTFQFASLASQGGSACNVNFTDSIAAAAVNVTVVGPVGVAGAAGFLSIYPTGTTSSGSFLNYVSGQTIANAGTIEMKQNGTANSQFNIFSQRQTDVIVDVFGAFVAPAATALACSLQSTNGPIAGLMIESVYATCPANTVATGGACTGGTYPMTLASTYMTATSYYCNWQNNDTNSHDAYATAQCCQIPGR